MKRVTNKSEVKFSNLVLSQFTLNQTYIPETCTFSNIKSFFSRLDNVEFLRPVLLSDCSFETTNFRDVRFQSQCIFSSSNFSRCTFEDCYFIRTDCDYCDFERTIFVKSFIHNNCFFASNFKLAKFYFTHLIYLDDLLKAIGINFENLDLTSAIFFYPKTVFNNQNNSSYDVKEFFNSSSTIIDSSIIYEDKKPPKVLLYDTSDENNHRRVDTIEISVDPARAY